MSIIDMVNKIIMILKRQEHGKGCVINDHSQQVYRIVAKGSLQDLQDTYHTEMIKLAT